MKKNKQIKDEAVTKNPKKKKVVKRILLILLIAAVVVGGGYGIYRVYWSRSVAKVVAVSSIATDYQGDEVEASGILTNDQTQSFYLSDENNIQEIYVTQGQQVSAGTPLLKYNTDETAQSLSEKQISVQQEANDIAITQAQLDRLRTITPVDDAEEENKKSEPQGEEKEQQAYRYLKETAKPYDGKGTEDAPYRFLCTEDCYATSTFLKKMQTKEWYCIFEVREKNKLSGEVISTTSLNGKHLFSFEDGSLYTIRTGEEYIIPDDEGNTTSKKYTRKELREEISSKQDELMELQNSYAKDQLEIKQLQESLSEATVTAKNDGVVLKLIDPAEYEDDGTPFMIVSASDKLYVQQQVDEYSIRQLKVGQKVKGKDWVTGTEFEAVVEKIADAPSTGSAVDMGYGGNTNVSYYTVTASVENTEGLENGDAVNLSTTIEEEGGGLFIEKAYCKQEKGKTIVYIRGKKGKLKRQEVTTGRTVWGSYVEIKEGLSEDDYIAFPYSDTSKEGVRCKKVDYLE